MRTDRKGNPYHPAKYSKEIIALIRPILSQECIMLVTEQPTKGYVPVVLDPFGGLGGIFDITEDMPTNTVTYCVEIEHEWADHARYKAFGSSEVICDDYFNVKLKYPVDVIITSPTYGNRMADKHDAKDASIRNTYKHSLGRELTEGSSAGMQWGDDYMDFHERAWKKVWDDLYPGGMFILNVKDHIRKGEVVPVSAWHKAICKRVGFVLEHQGKVETKGLRMGENHEARVDGEWVYVFRKPA